MKTVVESDGAFKKIKKMKKPIIQEQANVVPIVDNKVSPTINTTNLPPEFIKLLNNNLLQVLSKEVTNAKTNSKKVNEIKDFKVLESIVSEYLKTFLIIGYTLKGEKVRIGHVVTNEDNDALTEHMRQTFINIMNHSD